MNFAMQFDYEKYKKEQVTALGFDFDKLTETQKDILLQPSEAPENYHHDGEVSPKQAKTIWRENMKKAGFTALEVFKAERKIF